MIGSDAVGLVFRLKAENDTKGEIKEAKKDIDDLTKSADDSAQNGLAGFAQSLGLSAEKTLYFLRLYPLSELRLRV